MTVVRGSSAATLARRGLLAVVLLGAAVIPGRASSQTNPHCTGLRCDTPGSILWTRGLAGRWVAQDGVAGTVPATGGAYVASTGRLAVLGYGDTVIGFEADTGRRAWKAVLPGLAPRAEIVSLRAWPTEVAAGVEVPTAGGGESWYEVVFSAATGAHIRTYPAPEFGGAVWADQESTVIVGSNSVTRFANLTGKVIWSRSTGGAAQDWMVAGGYLYVAETSGSDLSSRQVTALHRFDMLTGAQRSIRPVESAFDGTPEGVVGGVVLFSNTDGLSAYSAQNGELRWQQPSIVLELVDQVRRTLYVSNGNALTSLNAQTGEAAGRPARALSTSLYAVKDGVALGLDQGQGALGKAWGYSMQSRKVVWTSAALPWPHYFVDLTGLGGSLSPTGAITLLTTCAAEGAPRGNNAAPCLQPELAALKF